MGVVVNKLIEEDTSYQMKHDPKQYHNITGISLKTTELAEVISR